MKTKVSSILTYLVVFILINSTSGVNAQNTGQPVYITTIDAADTVFFDIGESAVNSGYVEFPVFLRSDDIINAMDFEFSFDHSKLFYDTITSPLGYVDALSHYNTNDSIVRLTSYSFTQPYPTDTIVFMIRLGIIGNVLCSNDINNVNALLNGDACSNFKTGCLTGINETDDYSAITVYPNPATSYLQLNIPFIERYYIYDVTGKLILSESISGQEQIDITKLTPGTYSIITVSSDEFGSGKFVVIP